MSALTYTNRHRDRYYLHAGRTRTGKVRYIVAKTSGEGTLDAMPEGYEFAESINGVVSVRRIDRHGPQAPEQHVEMVRVEMGRHSHLRYYRAESARGEIVIFEPSSGLNPDAERASLCGIRGIESALDLPAARIRYAPIMKFAPWGRWLLFRASDDLSRPGRVVMAAGEREACQAFDTRSLGYWICR